MDGNLRETFRNRHKVTAFAARAGQGSFRRAHGSTAERADNRPGAQ